MAEKMTKRMVIEEMLANTMIKENKVWVDYLSNELELLDNKNKNRKSASDKEENIALREIVLESLTVLKSGTATEIQKNDDRLTGLSNQKMVALLRALIDKNLVVKDKVKGSTIFSLVEEV